MDCKFICSSWIEIRYFRIKTFFQLSQHKILDLFYSTWQTGFWKMNWWRASMFSSLKLESLLMCFFSFEDVWTKKVKKHDS